MKFQETPMKTYIAAGLLAATAITGVTAAI